MLSHSAAVLSFRVNGTNHRGISRVLCFTEALTRNNSVLGAPDGTWRGLTLWHRTRGRTAMHRRTRARIILRKSIPDGLRHIAETEHGISL